MWEYRTLILGNTLLHMMFFTIKLLFLYEIKCKFKCKRSLTRVNIILEDFFYRYYIYIFLNP